jgi:hypothetical protein
MRDPKDRRVHHAAPASPFENNGQKQVLSDRRSTQERRMENMAVEERQLQFSEMPWLTLFKKRKTKKT